MASGAQAEVSKPGSWGRSAAPAGARPAVRARAVADGGLGVARRTMVRLAIWIGFASTLAVAVATALPHHQNRATNDAAIYGLTAVAAGANAVFGLLALRWSERRGEEPLLVVWGVALIGLVAALTYYGGGYSSDYYLLSFLAISFVAATQRPRVQAMLFALLVAGYSGAVWAAPVHTYPGNLLLRVGTLAGAMVLAGYLAASLRAESARRARLQAESDLKNVLAIEANHRIKNNLQLVGDLLSFEASRPQASLPDVVEVTLGRVQAVAAVHALLSSSDNGQVQTRVVCERVLHTLTERMAPGGAIEAVVEGTIPDLDPQRATWLSVAVNELVTNALVHGFRSRGGRLVLTLEEGPEWRVVVTDDGEGCTGLVEGLGLGLVRRLVQDGLRGELTIDSGDGGTAVGIRFPAPAPVPVPTSTAPGRP
ncbi:MAG TPA: sensor histidine kinase [Actinomycetota bacterium]|nr:sensor histidine kinase [Actinomycetota bacterium]